MPKLVLLDRGEEVLTQWMFNADKNDLGHLTLKEPSHLTALIGQLQGALEHDAASYVLTELRPFPCRFCSRATDTQFCGTRCEKEMAIFPRSPVVCANGSCPNCPSYKRNLVCTDCGAVVEEGHIR